MLDAKQKDNLSREDEEERGGLPYTEEEFSIYSSQIANCFRELKEGNPNQPNTDVIRLVKRVIFGEKKEIENETMEMLATTFRKVVELCNMTPQEYDHMWSVRINKVMFLENLSRRITALASDEDKEECAFQRKRLLFKIVYPEYYRENYTPIKPYDLFFITGKERADLVRAAKPLLAKNERNDDNSISDGSIVDRLMFKSIEQAFKTVNITNHVQIMQILSDTQKVKGILNPSSEKKSSDGVKKNKPVPGCFTVINERKCYESYLDFYFLNLPKEDQIYLVDDYMEIRKEAGIRGNPMLDTLYDIFKGNEEDFLRDFFSTLD